KIHYLTQKTETIQTYYLCLAHFGGTNRTSPFSSCVLGLSMSWSFLFAIFPTSLWGLVLEIILMERTLRSVASNAMPRTPLSSDNASRSTAYLNMSNSSFVVGVGFGPHPSRLRFNASLCLMIATAAFLRAAGSLPYLAVLSSSESSMDTAMVWLVKRVSRLPFHVFISCHCCSEMVKNRLLRHMETRLRPERHFYIPDPPIIERGV